MKQLAKWALVFLGSWLSISSYAGSNHAFLTAEQLIQYCVSQDPRRVAFCEGYILAVNDTVVAGYLKEQIGICYPKGLKPTDLRLAVIEYLAKDTALQSYIAEGPVAEALSFKFPCENPPTKQ